MSDITSDEQILKDFQNESKNLIGEMIQILESCESDVGQSKELEEYAQRSDRMMGTAKTLSMVVSTPKLERFSDFASLCKAVGYKTSQLKTEQDFYVICVALLFDATEFLDQLNKQMLDEKLVLDATRSKAFLDRLRWISAQFNPDVRQTVGFNPEPRKEDKMSQSEIDQLIAKLGLD